MKFLSAFDLDHTLFCKNSSFEFGVYLYKQKQISLAALLFIIRCQIRHLLGWLPIQQLHQAAFMRLFNGRSSETVSLWAQKFVALHFDQLIYPPAVKALQQAQQAGHLTAILSSSPAFLVEPIAQRFGVSVWKSTDYAIDKDHRFCHIAHILLGEHKAQCLSELASQHQIAKQDITAYSDSHLDLPFLLAAGKATGVNPTRRLRAICKKNLWKII